MTKDIRARTWTIIVYPESAPKNWREQLDNLHIGWIESPLHDKDINPDGTKKKPHWHLMLLFEGKKSYSQIKNICDMLNSPIPQRCMSPKGMVRYFIHLDNPEKYQYKKEDIHAHGGADVENYFKMSHTNQLDILKDIVNYIHANHVTSLMDLTRYTLQSGNDEWFEVISTKSTVFLSSLLKSEWRKKQRRILFNENKTTANQVKELFNRKVSINKIADTLGISKEIVYKYLDLM